MPCATMCRTVLCCWNYTVPHYVPSQVIMGVLGDQYALSRSKGYKGRYVCHTVDTIAARSSVVCVLWKSQEHISCKSGSWVFAGCCSLGIERHTHERQHAWHTHLHVCMFVSCTYRQACARAVTCVRVLQALEAQVCTRTSKRGQAHLARSHDTCGQDGKRRPRDTQAGAIDLAVSTPNRQGRTWCTQTRSTRKTSAYWPCVRQMKSVHWSREVYEVST